jgi:multidrug efflux pump subunit AcrB
MNIGRFSVRHPVLINILMVTLLLFGTFSILRMPKEQFSEVPFYWVNIITPYPGVSAEDVEKTVTVPMEDQFTDIESLKRISSVTSEGLSLVRVEFDDGINDETFKRLFQESQTRVSGLDLPEGTLSPSVDDFSAADFLPVIEVVISGSADFETLNRTALELEEEIGDIRDVSTVDVVGTRDRQLFIDVNRTKIESLGVSIDEIVRAIRGRSVTIPGGTLVSGSREYLLRTVGELSGSEEFRKVIVRRSSAGSGLVHVGDLATVSEGFDPDGTTARFNGDRSVSLRISKVSGGDSLGVTEGVRELVESYRKQLPAGTELDLINDSTVQIRRSISILVDNFLFGFILLIAILLFFLGFRNALIIGVGLPVTFAMTFIILEYLGETVNTNTLFGLVLVLGLVVDHAIVIIENSYRLEQEGLSKIDAAVEGTNQVVFPVIAATATTVAAFLPLMILPGTIGKFLRVIPLVVSVALIVSTFEALVFLPVHFAEWSGKAKERAAGFFDRLRRGYRKLLEKVFRHRYLAAIGFSMITIGSFALVTTVQQDLFSAEDFTLFYIEIELPPGSPIEKTDQVVSRFEEKLLPLVGGGEVSALSSSIGFLSGGNGNTKSSNVAEIVVDLLEQDEGRNRSIPQIIQEVEGLCSTIPGAESVRYRKATNGPPVGSPLSFRLQGDNYNQLARASGEIRRKLAEYPELYNIDDDVDSGTPELQIRVNEEAAARYGLSVLSVGSYIRSSFDGVVATTIFRNNESIDVVVRFGAENRAAVDSFLQLSIPTPDGRLVPFTSVASVSESGGISSIKRVDGKREVTITSEAYNEERVRDINSQIEAYFQSDLAPQYPGAELKVGGEFAELAELLFQILRIFLIGVFLIYVILGTQFNSYAQPFLILFSIPFAFVGVVLFLVITGTPFSTTVLYAGVALAGIAVNDSIVLISFINELKEKNYAPEHAVLEAATLRLRPIMLTTITTIAGLLPTALGIGGASVVWGPMAGTIIFGLIFSTATALLIIPCVYGIWDDGNRKRRERKH